MTKLFNFFKKKKKNHIIDQRNIKEIIEPFKKPAWFPITKEHESEVSASKFSGIPILLKNETWPRCQNCNQPMQLFLQLDSNHLPNEAEKPFGDGILQVFYCTDLDKECESICEAFSPFSRSTSVRILNINDERFLKISSNPVKDVFPERAIISWEQKDDYPSAQELEHLGYHLTIEQCDLLCELGYPLSKDKLLGWPYWIQNVEYPDCPECGNKMKLIFQIDSEDNLPFMFGDIGCSHITQCETHRDKLAIAWACY